MTVLNSQITSGIVSQLAEGVGHSLIVPTTPMLAESGTGSGNSETNSSVPAVNPAGVGCAVERREEECASHLKVMQLTFRHLQTRLIFLLVY